MLFPAYGIAVRAVIDCAEAGPLSARISAISAAKWMARHRATRRRDFCVIVGMTASSGNVALIRSFARASAKTVGNFWVDLTRCTLYVLLPLSIIATLFFVWQGVPQNLRAYVDATTLEGVKQVISQGPAASQIAIKQLGTNGGGFWNANSAVPYENPTPLSNFVEAIYILLISAALTHTFGRMGKDDRQGWAVYAVMSILFFAGLVVCYWAEAHGNPQFAALGLDPANIK
jgi:potassium-transporting ATPase potassium-binding subunit